MANEDRYREASRKCDAIRNGSQWVGEGGTGKYDGVKIVYRDDSPVVQVRRHDDHMWEDYGGA